MSDEPRKKVNLEHLDLEKEKEKTADRPGLLAFPHTVGSALVKPEDMGKVKGRGITAMRQQTDRQMKQLYEQVQLLVDQANAIKKRVEVSERIYLAQMSFEPLIGHTYYLYEKKDGSDVLSLVAPGEWGRSFPYAACLARVTLLADHTWEVVAEPAS